MRVIWNCVGYDVINDNESKGSNVHVSTLYYILSIIHLYYTSIFTHIKMYWIIKLSERCSKNAKDFCTFIRMPLDKNGKKKYPASTEKWAASDLRILTPRKMNYKIYVLRIFNDTIYIHLFGYIFDMRHGYNYNTLLIFIKQNKDKLSKIAINIQLLVVYRRRRGWDLTPSPWKKCLW